MTSIPPPATRALVVANGDAVSPELLRELAAGAGLIVAADGGLHHLRAAGFRADLVTGDLDSLDQAEREELPPGALVPNTDPNQTDLQKAVALAISRRATQVDITCAGGGRADHALANLSMLVLFRDAAAVRIVDDQFEISLVSETDSESVPIEGPVGTIVSLVSLGGCSGVTTTGLRWDLANAEMTFSPYGIHNEIRESPASVSVRSGDLLLFKGRWVEKHR